MPISGQVHQVELVESWFCSKFASNGLEYTLASLAFEWLLDSRFDELVLIRADGGLCQQPACRDNRSRKKECVHANVS
jgi:hypothetical protein